MNLRLLAACMAAVTAAATICSDAFAVTAAATICSDAFAVTPAAGRAAVRVTGRATGKAGKTASTDIIIAEHGSKAADWQTPDAAPTKHEAPTPAAGRATGRATVRAAVRVTGRATGKAGKTASTDIIIAEHGSKAADPQTPDAAPTKHDTPTPAAPTKHEAPTPADSTRHEAIDSTVIQAYSFYENSISAFGSPVVDMKAIAVPQNATVEQILRLMPSIDVRERGGKSIQTDISIRGGGSDQTGMLLNGIDFTDIRTGHQTHSLLDGGNQGLTGALNMITDPRSPQYLRAHVAGGAFGYRYANVSGATTVQRRGTLEIFEAASLKQSDGYRPSTDFRNANAYARVKYTRRSIGTLDDKMGYQDRAFGANGFYSLKFPDQFEQTTTALGSLRWNKAFGRMLLESYVSYRRNTDRFELIRGSESKVPFNYHITDNYGSYLSASYVWSAGRTSLSGECRSSDILSTVLGEALDEPVAVQGGSDRFYTKGGGRTWGNVQLRHQKQWGRFGVKAAVEGDFSPYGFTPLWNAGLDWKPGEGWALKLIGARTMRLPTYTDLYYTATGYIGNPDLIPEKATMAIAGAEYRRSIWNACADVFYRRGDDIIDWVRPGADADWESRQVTRLSTAGADLSLSLTPQSGVLRSLTLRGGYVWQDKDAGSLISKYAMDYMRFKSSVVADLRFGRHVSLSADASCYDRVGNYADAAGEVLSYRPYAILNATLSYSTRAWRFYVEMDNVTSTRYFDFGGLEMPGCWTMCGIVVMIE
ncbi:MAG: TonB-dependent receptor [Bacteroidales bacterium]|nr:TonB-dependent receptor [Bacteroidales bacterium]